MVAAPEQEEIARQRKIEEKEAKKQKKASKKV